MDPSVYARAFGVQSESNKVTVTRVASNEIVYRRTVDTYRKNMTSTMTSIKREQKRLKRNMRHYRRRMRDVKHEPLEKPFKIGWIACASDSSFDVLPPIEKQVRTSKHSVSKTVEDAKTSEHLHKTNLFETGGDSRHNSKLQVEVDSFLKSIDEYVHSPRVKKQEMVEADTANEIIYDKKGRRRFLFGPSTIGKLAELELETEGYTDSHDLSDVSSEDDEDGDTDGKTKSRRKKKKGLVRLSSAYFTAIDMTDHNRETLEIHPANKTTTDQDSNCQTSDETNKTLSSVQDEVTGQILISNVDNNTIQSNDVLGKQIAQSFPQKISIERIMDDNDNALKELPSENVKEETPTQDRIRNKTSKVNFGDLIKFQHGSNTKKLFSFVDQLASKYGVLSTKKEEVPDIKRGRGFNNFGDQQSLATGNENSAKNSIFYAIEYGYGKQNDLLENEEDKYPGMATDVPGTYRNLLYSDNEDQTDALDVEKIIHTERDTIDGSATTNHRERRTGLPLLNVDKPPTSRHSMVSTLDDKETEKGRSSNVSHFSRPLRKSEVLDKRRSSILDASNYVSNMRKKSILQEHYLLSSKNESDRFGQGRKMGKESLSEHQRKADDSKIAWSSALGRMKLIHTLVDLTHFI